MSTQTRFSLRFLLKALFGLSLQLVSHSSMATCCWMPADTQLLLDDQTVISGTVQSKRISTDSLLIKTNAKKPLKLVFDKANGSKEQHQLIYTLNKGDEVTLRYMKDRNAFHIDTGNP